MSSGDRASQIAELPCAPGAPVFSWSHTAAAVSERFERHRIIGSTSRLADSVKISCERLDGGGAGNACGCARLALVRHCPSITATGFGLAISASHTPYNGARC